MQKLAADKLIPFELLGEPWVLFRDETGAAACVKDECAHRACPLSLGTVRFRPRLVHTAASPCILQRHHHTQLRQTGAGLPSSSARHSQVRQLT